MGEIDKLITADVFAKYAREHSKEMYAVSYGILRNLQDAEDATQNALLKAYERLDTLKDEKKFKSWLMRILVNESKQILRKKERAVAEDILEDELTVTSLEDNFWFWSVVYSLEEELRIVVILFYYQGYMAKEIAAVLQIPLGTVHSRLSRARKKLKEILST